MRALACLFASAWLFVASAAFADVVNPEPENCPEGSLGATCHGGPHCVLRKCGTDAECKAGESCQDRQLCVSEINCGGGWVPPDAAPPLSTDVHGPCNDGACAQGQCGTHKVCVSGSGSGSSSGGGDGTGTESGCACVAAGGGAAPLFGLGAFAFGLGVLASRRRRPGA